jgi:hypothetical protein
MDDRVERKICMNQKAQLQFSALGCKTLCGMIIIHMAGELKCLAENWLSLLVYSRSSQGYARAERK